MIFGCKIYLDLRRLRSTVEPYHKQTFSFLCSEWSSPLKLDQPHLSTSTPGQTTSDMCGSGRRRSPTYDSTDTSGISSDASASSDTGVVFMRPLNLDNPLVRRSEMQKRIEMEEEHQQAVRQAHAAKR